jgi:hypothetical protein
MADRLGLEDKSFAAIRLATDDIRQLMIDAAFDCPEDAG